MQSAEQDGEVAHSLLTEVPEGRNCAQAGIPDEFCSCNRMVEVDVTFKVLQRASDAFDEVLEKLLSDVGDICARMRVNRILKAHRIVTTNIYVLEVETKPKVGGLQLRVGCFFVREERRGDVLAKKHIGEFTSGQLNDCACA